MGRAAKTYIYGVTGLGALLLAWALTGLFSNAWSPAALGWWIIYAGLAVLASTLKLKLPGMDGTYSFSFLFMLYGVAHFSLAGTLIAGCAGALAQSLLNTKKRPTAPQVLFNAANVAISAGICFIIARVWLVTGMVRYPLAVMVLVACAYFLINTLLVSGVLALLQSKPLAEVSSQWYVWSFPYYLIGVVLVELVPAPGHAVAGEAWLVLVPMVYLVHFFLGLVDWHTSLPAIGDRPNGSLPLGARNYLIGVVLAGVATLAVAAVGWESQNSTRFIVELALAVVAATCKIKLPSMRATLAPAFVLLLTATAQLSFAETVVMATVVGLVQALWRAKRRPMVAQTLFNPACLALSAALAWLLTRVALHPWLGDSVAGVLVVSTLILYSSNTVMVSTMLALVDRKPLASVWQRCYFWSFPYYLVGAAAAGIMTAISRAADWAPSLLVLPLMGLVYVRYRMQLSQAVSRCQMATA